MSTRNKHRNPLPTPRDIAQPPLLGLMATWLLMAVLLLMAVRLSWGESLFFSITEYQAAAANPDSAAVPTPGLATIIDCSVIMLALAAMVAWTQKLSRSHVLWLVIALILAACAAGSVVHAPAKLLALAGACDLVMAVLAGWSVFVLLQHKRLRPLVFAVIAAVFAAWTFRVFVQKYVDNPDTLEYFKQYRSTIFGTRGWADDSPEARFYEARLRSAETGGFQPLSNVFAAGQVGLLLVAVALLLQIIAAMRAQPKADGAIEDRKPGEIPVPVVVAVLLGLLVIAGAATLAFSESKGASASAIVVGAVVIAGCVVPAWFARHRKSLTAAGVAIVIAGMLGTVAYGLTHHGLPTRSLLFRWHYWVGTVPIIEQHPLLGVGLNNFGSYYGQFKLPFAPEDPKDPHSFFVRLAVEIGLPATFLLLGLLAWLFIRSTRTRSESDDQPGDSPIESIFIGAVFCLLWFAIRIPFAEQLNNPFDLAMDAIYCMTAIGAFALAIGAARFGAMGRPLIMAAVAAAFAILLYDQVNMAAVTGAVAMLFWVLLALGQPQNDTIAKWPRLGRWLAPAMALCSLGLLVTTSTKLAAGDHPWDVSRIQIQLADAVKAKDWKRAETLVDQSLAVDARAGELLRTRITVRFAQGSPIADDIRALLATQPNDPQLRVRLVREIDQGQSDWPVKDRIAALEKALKLDEGFAWLDTPKGRDPKRFSDAQLAEIHQMIAKLRAATQPAEPSKAP